MVGEAMNKRMARWLAWFGVGAYVVLSAIGLVLQLRSPYSFGNMGIPVPVLIIFYAFLGVWPVIGALILTRRPQHPVGWVLGIGIPVVAMDSFAFGYAAYELTSHLESLPGMTAILLWLNWSGMPLGIAIFTLLLLLSPDGKFYSRPWRIVAGVAAGALFVYLAIKALEPGPLVLFPALNNPIAVAEAVWVVLAPLQWAAITILSLCFAGAIVSLIIRLRNSRGDVRQQIKWLIFPATLFWIGIPFNVLGEYESSGTVFGLGGVTHMVAATGMIIATAIGIFRYRLYDIDPIINRTLVYGALTGTLALVYFVSVVLLQQVFPAESQISIVISTLAIAGLFTPLRRGIQNAIDKRFYRRKYDAQQTLAAFSARLRDEVELKQLSETLLAVVHETMHPTHASLWFRPPGRL